MEATTTRHRFFYAGDHLHEVKFSKRGYGGWNVYHKGNHLGWVCKNSNGWAAYAPNPTGPTTTQANWEAVRLDAVRVGLSDQLEASAAGWWVDPYTD